MGTSWGAVALAAQLQRQAMEIAEHEIEALDIGAEVSGADMEAIRAWGARMYLLGLGDRASVARHNAATEPAPQIEWCECGHQKSEHGAGRGGAPGRGACLASAMPGGRRRCACSEFRWTSKAPKGAAPRVEVRRRRLNRPTSDRKEVRDACAANRHRTPGKDGMCACGVFPIDQVGGGK
jgi:hypothetical protein